MKFFIVIELGQLIHLSWLELTFSCIFTLIIVYFGRRWFSNEQKRKTHIQAPISTSGF